MLYLVELDAELSNLLRARTIGLEDGAGIFALTFRTRDFVARRVLVTLQTFELGYQPAATVLQNRERFELAVGVHAAALQPALHVFLVISNKSRIKHDGILIN